MLLFRSVFYSFTNVCYFSSSSSFPQIQLTTLAMSLTLSGYVCLICLFSPKIYIILRHPDKNVRKLTMNSGTYKKGPSGSGYPQETPPPYSPGPSNSAPNRSLPPTSYGKWFYLYWYWPVLQLEVKNLSLFHLQFWCCF